MGSVLGSSPSNEMKAMRLPSGDHCRSLTPFGMAQTCFASPPSAGMTYNWGLSFSPSPFAVKARRLLSGDHLGQVSSCLRLLKGRASPPEVSTTQIFLEEGRAP